MLGLTAGQGVVGWLWQQHATRHRRAIVAAGTSPASSSLSPSCALSSAIWPGMRGRGRRTQSVCGSYLAAHPHT
jgi:hypothetical protein